MNGKKAIVSIIASIFLVFNLASAATLLDPAEQGFAGQTRSENYDALLDAMFAEDTVVMSMGGDRMWVPWYKTSSRSEASDLQDGNNCAAGQAIDFDHNCMVTDEFSQVGVLVSMGDDEDRMRQFYNTVRDIRSDNGNLPSWRVYRDGDTIEACKDGINGNCDSASDADARIIIALYAASQNPLFQDEAMKAEYASFATQLADDMLAYEVDQTCRPTPYGEVCHWLAGGANVKEAGIGASDYAYTGYYPDAIIALLAAHGSTGEEKYLLAAQDITLNYLQAARFDGQSFSAPPGKSFKWVEDAAGQPQAVCTNTCEPPMWDGFDASRALGMCQAEYYAEEMGVQLPQLEEYCGLLSDEHMGDPSRAPLQFRPDGEAVSYQSGYYAQGLQALHQAGSDQVLFERTLDNALAHFNPSTGTFDNEPSFGIYTKMFAVRALGMGIGRDHGAFVPGTAPVQEQPREPAPEKTVFGDGIASLQASCEGSVGACSLVDDVTVGSCRTVRWSAGGGAVQVQACEKSGGFVEVYRQSLPAGVRACVGAGCVDEYGGFARFEPSYEEQPSAPAVEDAQPVEEVPEADQDKAENPAEPAPVEDAPAEDSSSTGNDGSLSLARGVASLQASCEGSVGVCSLVDDVTVGSCRTVRWSAGGGAVQVQACEKSGGFVEVYRQSLPAGVRACVGAGCVDEYGGFARFEPSYEEQPSTAPTTTDPVEEAESPVLVITGIGFFPVTCEPAYGQCRLVEDSTSGSCRTLRWESDAGPVRVLSCEKADGYAEVYRQQMPSGAAACVGPACVDDQRGFATVSW